MLARFAFIITEFLRCIVNLAELLGRYKEGERDFSF